MFWVLLCCCTECKNMIIKMNVENSRKAYFLLFWPCLWHWCLLQYCVVCSSNIVMLCDSYAVWMLVMLKWPDSCFEHFIAFKVTSYCLSSVCCQTWTQFQKTPAHVCSCIQTLSTCMQTQLQRSLWLTSWSVRPSLRFICTLCLLSSKIE